MYLYYRDYSDIPHGNTTIVVVVGFGFDHAGEVWPEGETSRDLDPDGYLVRRTDYRHHVKENRDASKAQVEGEFAKHEGHGKKLSKVVQGDGLPLDRRLLMGVFLSPALTASQEFARVEILLLSEEDEHDKGCGYGHRFTYP